MQYLLLDIETVSNDRASEYVQKKNYEPDARLKDPEKIEASILSKRQADIDKAGLYWWLGKIVCLSMQDLKGKSTTFVGHDEKKILIDFFDALEDMYKGAQLIGKSSVDFDFPFIIGRALAHNIGLPDHFRKQNLRDIDHIFSFSARCSQTSSLSNYAWGLGIGGKIAHGSEVQGMYNMALAGDQKQWAVISEYCEHDVNITTEMLKRYLKPYREEKTPIIDMKGVF